MSCIKKMTDDLNEALCSTPYKAQGGLDGGKVYIINKSDIDVTSLTKSGVTITNLNLYSGATAFEIGFVKQLSNTASEFSVNDGLDSFTHSFVGRAYGTGANELTRVKELSEGEFVVIAETKWKGANNAGAFKVYGIANGLRMSEGSYTSLENEGSFLFTLSSVENFGEPDPMNIYLETSYAATKAKLETLFA
jgi:hypothetical protein